MPRPTTVLQVNFDYRRLKEDTGLTAKDIVELFYKHYGIRPARATIYVWFNKGGIPLQRFIELLAVLRIETNRKLDIWRYIEVPLIRKAA